MVEILVALVESIRSHQRQSRPGKIFVKFTNLNTFQNLADMNRLWFEAIKQAFVFYVTIQIGETVLHALQHEIGEIKAKHSQWMMSLQE